LWGTILIFQDLTPEDALGQTHSIIDFLEVAFGCVGLDWRKHVVVDKELYRPAEIHELRGESSMAKRKLGWESSLSFNELVQMMVESDLKAFSGEKTDISRPDPKLLCASRRI
jgi:GDPmannose 4,6-dehydratase